MDRLGVVYWSLTATMVLTGIVGLARSGRRVHGGMALIALVFQVVQLFSTYPLLG